MRNITKGIVSLLLITGLVPVLNADSIFNFDADTPVPNPPVIGTTTPPGTQTNFTDSNNGISATFSSASPSAFIVQSFNNFTNFGGGNNLYENDFLTPKFVNQILSVNFSSVLNSSTLNFALNPEAGGNSMTLTAFLNGTQVGTPLTLANSGAAPNGTGGFSYLYGALAFSGVDFNSISLSSNADEFAIDDLVVTPSATPVSGVPEPASVALMFFGLAGILAYVRRHLRKEAA